MIGLFVPAACSWILCAQEPVRIDTLSSPEPYVESTLEDATQDADDSQLGDVLARLQEEPLDLNSATAEELQQIPRLSPMIAFQVIAHRSARPFGNPAELMELDGMDRESFNVIRPFVTVRTYEESVPSFHLNRLSVRSRTASDLQERRGYREGTYPGSPIKIYNRLTVASELPSSDSDPTKLAGGILTEKDAGEGRLNNFVAGFVDARAQGVFSRILVGDFIVEQGRGLVFWRSIGISKGSDVLSPPRLEGSGIQGYLSTDENMFFRGVATSLDLGPASLTALYSNKILSASANANGEITSIYASGLFRTASERSKKYASRERVAGLLVNISPLRGMRIGIHGYEARFLHPLALASHVDFRGTTASVIGAAFAYTQKGAHSFFEVASDRKRSVAGVGGVSVQPWRGAGFTLVARVYPRSFNSFHSFGFGESGGRTENESGVYVGSRIRLTPWLHVSAYYDQFSFPWTTSSSLFPSSGNDFLGLGEVALGRKLDVRLQYRVKNKGSKEGAVDAIGRLTEEDGLRKQQNYRVTLEFRPSITFRWQNRMEWVSVRYRKSKSSESGFLAYQDVRIIPFERLLVDSRLILFETDSYDSRVYEFEKDVEGVLSNPGVYGKGLRWYAVVRYEISRSVDVWLKYAATTREDVTAIGSGPDEIPGDTDNRLTLQIDINL